MNKGEIKLGTVIFTVFMCLLVIYMSITFDPKKKTIHNYYQVYLGGEKIGLISSDKELYDLIDNEQQEIKDKYNVDKVYSPSGLEVREVSTYSSNLMTAKEVYDEIKDIDPFTIEGYEVTITEDGKKKKFYILNKKDLDAAVKNTVLAFVDEKVYNNYLNGEQEEIKDTGKEITNIYLQDNVSIKKTYISTEENIITDLDTLSMYFLFGTTELRSKYKVKATDTIETIAYRSKLGVSDFLIANPEIAGENALLAVGQEVNVAYVAPLSDIVIEYFETEYQTIKYETKAIYDKTLNSDQTYVKQQGSNGLSKVTFATKQVNNNIINSAQVSHETIKEAQDRVIVYGAKNVVYYGNTTYWAWPTVKPFKIASPFGYRIHPIRHTAHLHSGVDIIGTSSKNIFAAQAGKVITAAYGYNSGAGNNVKIDHGNGYITQYMHLSKIRVKKGQTVEKGEIVGIMGCTGSCTGTHLHFTVYKDGKLMNPMNLYK